MVIFIWRKKNRMALVKKEQKAIVTSTIYDSFMVLLFEALQWFNYFDCQWFFFGSIRIPIVCRVHSWFLFILVGLNIDRNTILSYWNELLANLYESSPKSFWTQMIRAMQIKNLWLLIAYGFIHEEFSHWKWNGIA